MHLLKELMYGVMLIIELIYLLALIWKMAETMYRTMHGHFKTAGIVGLETITTGVMVIGIDQICKWLRP